MGLRRFMRRLTSNPIKTHYNNHYEIREYACDQCDKKFVTSNALNLHFQAHEGIVYKCKLCPDYSAKSKTTVSFHFRVHHPNTVKGCPAPSHFIFGINVGKSRIRHTTTLKLIDEFRNRLKILKMTSFKFGFVLCRIRLFPTFISKIKLLGSGLPLRFVTGTLYRTMSNKSEIRL